MDTRTGEIYPSMQAALDAGVPPEFLKEVSSHPLTEHLEGTVADLQKRLEGLTARQQETMQVLPYEQCPCGSGKKFKFCCYAKAQAEINLRQAEKLVAALR